MHLLLPGRRVDRLNARELLHSAQPPWRRDSGPHRPQGKTVVDFVIQYEAFIDGRYRPVVRYDGSHGTPHRDTLDWDDETIKKDWDLEATTHNDAVTEAIDDIQANWERYLDGFLRRRP